MENACLYWAISDLYNQEIDNIDVYNLTTAINSNGAIKRKLKDKYSEQTLKELISTAPLVARNTPEEYIHIVNIVKELHLKRQLIQDLRECEKMCFLEEIEPQQLQRNIFNTLDKTSSEFLNLEKVPEYKDVIDKLWAETESRQVGGLICGNPSKFPTLNNYCTYEKGELVVVCAHRKEGKSIICLNELVHQLGNNESCLYIDTEMSSRLFNERLLSHLTKISVRDLKAGNYNYDQKVLIREKIEWLKSRQLTHIYLPSSSKQEIYTIAKKLKRYNNMGFLIYDYFKSSKGTDASSVYNDLGNMTNFIKNDIVGELELSGLGAAQLNRGGEIADSYKIEQYVSTILTLKRKTQEEVTRDGGKEYGNYKLFVKLNRLGEQMADIDTEYIDLNFNGNVCTFEEAKQHDTGGNPFAE